jgi:hypothetical protein
LFAAKSTAAILGTTSAKSGLQLRATYQSSDTACRQQQVSASFKKDGLSKPSSFKVLLNLEPPSNIRTCSADFLEQMEIAVKPANLSAFAGPDSNLRSLRDSLREATTGVPTNCTTFLYSGRGTKMCFRFDICLLSVGDFDEALKVDLNLLSEEVNHTPEPNGSNDNQVFGPM